MVIKWRDGLTIDGGMIDADHHRLIDIVNLFESQADTYENVDQILEILMQLKMYTKVHFEREEHLQWVCNYPFQDAHHKEHVALIQQLDALTERTRADTGRAMGELSRETAVLLHDWLVDHIIRSDLRMKPYTKAMAVAARSMKRLDQHVEA